MLALVCESFNGILVFIKENPTEFSLWGSSSLFQTSSVTSVTMEILYCKESVVGIAVACKTISIGGESIATLTEWITN